MQSGGRWGGGPGADQKGVGRGQIDSTTFLSTLPRAGAHHSLYTTAAEKCRIFRLLSSSNSLLFLTRPSSVRCCQVLLKSCRMEENADAFVLLEDVQKSRDPREVEKGGGGSQRVLDRDEKVLQAQSKWRGSGRFIVRKSGSVRTNHLHC